MDDSTDTAQTAQDAPEQAQTESEGKGLRKQLESALKENKDLKAIERNRAFMDAGIDIAAGLGKAISQVYDGEPTQEAIQAFARDEYGWVAPATDAHPQAQQIVTEQGRADQLSETSGSVAPPTQQEALAKAELEGDTDTSMAIKSQQLAGLIKP